MSDDSIKRLLLLEIAILTEKRTLAEGTIRMMRAFGEEGMTATRTARLTEATEVMEATSKRINDLQAELAGIDPRYAD